MSAEQLLEACDTALLRSKRAGKGRVELALPEGRLEVGPLTGWPGRLAGARDLRRWSLSRRVSGGGVVLF